MQLPALPTGEPGERAMQLLPHHPSIKAAQLSTAETRGAGSAPGSRGLGLCYPDIAWDHRVVPHLSRL